MASVARIDRTIDLAPQTSLLSAVLESSPEGLAVVEGGTILYANPAFARLFGLTPAEIEGTAVANLLPGVLDQSVSADVHEVWAGPRNGPPLALQISSSPLNWSQRQLRVLALRDLSEDRKLAQAERQESRDREIALRLTHRLAQDLNNLLSAITLSSDVIAEELEVGRRPRLHVDKIRAASQHGEALVRKLMAIVRLEAKNTSPVNQLASPSTGHVSGFPTPGIAISHSPGVPELKTR
jgi:PAS domain S-box-containing protein